MTEGSPELDRAKAIYAHLASAEHVWISRLRGHDPKYEIWPDLSLAEAAELARTSLEELDDFVSNASEEELETQISYRNSAGREFLNRAIDLVQHVALHGAYHRGQLALLARMAGAEPASTDFIAYLRGAPAPRGGGHGPGAS